MGNFKNNLFRFMYGRYGTYGLDVINTILFFTYVTLVFVCTVIAFFVHSIWFTVAYLVLTAPLAIWMMARMFSRNVAARRRENERFCGFFKLIRNKIRDRKTHVYRKCPNCKAVLRLPKAKGKHSVVCPRCKQRFEVKG